MLHLAIYIISKSPLLKLQIKLNRNVLPIEDSPLLVFWYKDMFGSPFYTFDIRNGMHAASHFKNEQEGSGAVLAHLMFGEEKNPSSTWLDACGACSLGESHTLFVPPCTRLHLMNKLLAAQFSDINWVVRVISCKSIELVHFWTFLHSSQVTKELTGYIFALTVIIPVCIINYRGIE